MTAMSRGPIIRQVLGGLVQAAAVLMAVLLFIDWCRMWRAIRWMSFVEGVGYFVLLLGLLYGGFLALQTMFVRGGQIREMPESDYVVAPIVGLLAAMWGEMTFLFLAAMSVPAMIAAWCASQSVPLPLIWSRGSQNDFLDGIFVFLACWITGFVALVIGRWIKEWVLVIIQIAQDVHAIRSKSAPESWIMDGGWLVCC